jgi:hypothetical protein
MTIQRASASERPKEESLMKRLLIPAVSAMALALAVPGAALARGHGHHSHHKAKSHHAAKARVEHFGPKSTAAPTTTAPTSSDNAGTVASFVAGTTPGTGVLTLTLNDGSTVSGKVTTDTNIECQAPATATASDNQGGGGGDNSSGDGTDGQQTGTTGASGPTAPSGPAGPSGTNDSTGTTNTTGSGETSDQNETGDQNTTGSSDQGDSQSAACSTTDLVPGAVVHEADLRIGSTGAEFKSVKLVK